MYLLLLTALSISCKPKPAIMGTIDGSEAIPADSTIQSADNDENSEGEASLYLDAVLNQLDIKLEDCYKGFITEKVLPYSTDMTVMVIPKIAHSEDDFWVLDAYIVIIDNNTKNIVHKFYEKDAWTSDAIMLNSISIDTAPYRLNETIRAFGVRLSYANNSRPNPYSESLLSLFIPDGDKLVRVLKDYPVDTYHGDWDTRCAGEFTSVETVLIMSDKQTNGYNNIIAKGTITTEINKPNGDDCDSEQSSKNTTETLRYEDGQYQFKK